jgi:hypothetical protein
MAFTTTNKSGISTLLLILAAGSNAASIGLPTRDQNPLLQAYFLPSIDMQVENGWHLSHALYITNTFQEESRGSEELVIDVENYRYDFSLSYQTGKWRLGARLPLISNDPGELDSLIEDWHDIFGLPQGGRTENPNDQFNLTYSRNGNVIFEQSNSDSDIGDLALLYNYRLTYSDTASTELGIGIELPTGSIDSISGNEEIDSAFWINRSVQVSENSLFYGMFGLSLPGNDGHLKYLIKNRIWFSQLGSEYDFNEDITGILQLDFHTSTLKNTELKAFENSLQMQFALQFQNWFDNYSVDLFFSEDILVKSAPDITFGLRISRVALD